MAAHCKKCIKLTKILISVCTMTRFMLKIVFMQSCPVHTIRSPNAATNRKTGVFISDTMHETLNSPLLAQESDGRPAPHLHPHLHQTIDTYINYILLFYLTPPWLKACVPSNHGGWPERELHVSVPRARNNPHENSKSTRWTVNPPNRAWSFVSLHITSHVQNDLTLLKHISCNCGKGDVSSRGHFKAMFEQKERKLLRRNFKRLRI